MSAANRRHYVMLCIMAACAASRTSGHTTLQAGTWLCNNRTSHCPCCGPFCCHNGDCHRAPNRVSCRCQAGWLPPTCAVPCDLDCPNGRCEGSVRGGQKHMYCVCNRTHKGHLCDMQLCLKECVNGRCVFVSGVSGPQQCSCKDGFVGDLCERPDPNVVHSWYWPTVGTVVAVGLLLLLAVVVTPYVMWRKRVLIVLRIHYFFQRYKDDDNLRFDAFVSCAANSKDIEFLRETLVPTLEDVMGYTVCFGDRNFNPGKSYLDSTCLAVTQSRRTLLLLTPAFMEDTWPIFEVQLAQHESLLSAHGIIPIVFRDLGKVTHPTLKNTLSSLQCLKWPAGGSTRQIDQFWKKLRILMPKVQPNACLADDRLAFVA